MPIEPLNSPKYDIPAILEAQRAFFSSGRTLPIEYRRESLRRLEEGLKSHTDGLLDALTKDLGKPRIEAYLSEIYFLISEVRLHIKHLPKWAKPEKRRTPFFFKPGRSEVRREPLGTTLIASAWNYPLQLSLAPALSAISAGNVVLLKPSELAPHTAQAMAELVAEAFDTSHFTVVQGGPETAQSLLAESFDSLFYTGSTPIGRLYAEAAARSLAPVTLELGGKCPCIIAEDTDLRAAAKRIIAGKFFNAGQTCIAPDFVLVPAALKQSFLDEAKEALHNAFPSSPSEDLARIINERHFDRLSNLVTPDSIRVGEDIPGECYLAPTLIPDVDWDAPSMNEEIFGPILPILSYDDLDETLKRLNNQPSPLALYAFSKDTATLERIAASVPSGSVCFNDVMKQATNLDLPFGGVGGSGMGRYRGKAGFENFTYERAFTRRGLCCDPFAVTPPYQGQFKRMRKLLK